MVPRFEGGVRQEVIQRAERGFVARRRKRLVPCFVLRLGPCEPFHIECRRGIVQLVQVLETLSPLTFALEVRSQAAAFDDQLHRLAAAVIVAAEVAGDMDRAKRLQDSGMRMWSAFNVEPEEWNYKTMAPTTEAGYQLRPEIME